MNPKIMILSVLLAGLLFSSTLVLAQTDTGANTGSANVDEVSVMTKSKMRVEVRDRLGTLRLKTERLSQIRNQLGGLSEADAEVLVAARANIDEIRNWDEETRTEFIARLREKYSDDDLRTIRERRARLEVRDARVEKIRAAYEISDLKLRNVQRLRVAEETVADLRTEDSVLHQRLTALRTKLEAKATLSNVDAVEVDGELLKLRQKHVAERGEAAVERAQRISDKMGQFIQRMEAKYDELVGAGKEAPALENAIEHLSEIHADLDASIVATQSAWTAANADGATREEVKALHEALVRMRVHARHAVNAIDHVVRWIHAHQNGRTVTETERAEIEASVERLDEVVVTEEVVAEVTISSDDSLVETDDSGNDSPSDTDDSDEDNGGDAA